MSELNLDNAICNLLIKALNKHNDTDLARKELGVCRNTLYKYIRKFNIVNGKFQWVKK